MTADTTAAPHSRDWLLASTVSAVVVIVARVVTSWGRREYALWPDEPAQLAIARYVGGGTPWNMHNHSVWRPLYGTLLSPVYWFTDEPVTVYRAAMGLNAVLGGVAAVLLVVLARRLTTMGPWWCAFAAIVVSVSPAALLTTEFVFAESLVVPIYLATLWLLLRFHDSPSAATGVPAGVLAGLAFGTHSRMLPLAAVVVGVALLAAWQRRLTAAHGAVIGATTAASVLAMSAYTTFLIDRLWNEPSTRNSPDGVIGQLGNVPATLLSLTGQTWTLLVSSVGVVAYGVVALVRARRADATIVLVTVGLCVGLSVVFMSDRWRNDQLVYGRYNAAVVGPVLVVGIAVVLGHIRLPRFAATVAGTAGLMVVAAAVLWSTRGDLFRDGNGLEPMILGLQPFVTSATVLDVPRITAWAVAWTLAVGVVAGAVAGVSRLPRLASAALVTMLVAVGTVVAAHRLDEGWDDSGDASAVTAVRERLDGIAVDYTIPAGSDATLLMMLHQYYLPRTLVSVVHDAVTGTPGSYVFAPADDAGLRDAGATRVWRDPRRDVALWQR